jgi:hypothetical protein
MWLGPVFLATFGEIVSLAQVLCSRLRSRLRTLVLLLGHAIDMHVLMKQQTRFLRSDAMVRTILVSTNK